MDIKKIADYKSMIYGNDEIEKMAVAGAVAGLFKAFAPKIGELGAKGAGKATKAYNSFATSSVAKKTVAGAGVGATAGAVKGSTNYNAAQDDGSFGKSRIGQVAKGALGGAAMGAAAGGALGVATKGMKPINRVSTPPVSPTATGTSLAVQKGPSVTGAPKVSQPAPQVKPVGAKVNPTVNPKTGHIELDPSQYRVSSYIDDLYMEKVASNPQSAYEYLMR